MTKCFSNNSNKVRNGTPPYFDQLGEILEMPDPALESVGDVQW